MLIAHNNSRLTIICTMALLGCRSTNETNINKVKPGMTMPEVLAIMGPPELIEANQKFIPKEADTMFVFYWETPMYASSNFSVFFAKNDSIAKRVDYGL